MFMSSSSGERTEVERIKSTQRGLLHGAAAGTFTEIMERQNRLILNDNRYQ